MGGKVWACVGASETGGWGRGGPKSATHTRTNMDMAIKLFTYLLMSVEGFGQCRARGWARLAQGAVARMARWRGGVGVLCVKRG